jgi:hypothetical protein
MQIDMEKVFRIFIFIEKQPKWRKQDGGMLLSVDTKLYGGWRRKEKERDPEGGGPFLRAIFSKAWQPCPEELSLVADLVEDSRVLSALSRVPLYFLDIDDYCRSF